eukprot:34497-Rhodomonas_salina.3
MGGGCRPLAIGQQRKAVFPAGLLLRCMCETNPRLLTPRTLRPESMLGQDPKRLDEFAQSDLRFPRYVPGALPGTLSS